MNARLPIEREELDALDDALAHVEERVLKKHNALKDPHLQSLGLSLIAQLMMA